MITVKKKKKKMWDWMRGHLIWVTSSKPKGSVPEVGTLEDPDEGRPVNK